MNMDVVCVGSAGFDIFVSGKDIRPSQLTRNHSLSLAVGHDYPIEHAVYEVGGSAVNTAITLARQGIKTGCIARTGKDHLANQIKIVAKYEQLEPGMLISNPQHHTDMRFHINVERNQEITLSYDSSMRAMRPKDLYYPGLRSRLLFLSELPFDFKLYKFFVNWARANRVYLAVSVNDFRDYRQKQINYVLATANKLMMPLSYAFSVFHETADPVEIIRQIKAFGADSVVLYDVMKEAYAYEDETVFSCGVYKKLNPLDITGCEDVFCAGYLAAIFQQKSIPEGLTLASAMACSVSEVLGTRAGILRKPALRTMKTNTEVL